MLGRNGLFFAAIVLCLGVLYLLPVRMGNGANAHIPIIGAAERISEEYCEKTLVRATAAYASAKVVDKAVSSLQRVELSFAPFGVGMSVAPGEMLAAVNDAIERVSAAFFFVMGLMLVEKLLLGMVAWVSFKVLLPMALVFAACYCLFGHRAPWSRAAALFFSRTALVCWLFFPLSAWVSSYVETAYLSPVYEAQMAGVENSSLQMEHLEGEMNRSLEQASVEEKEGGWFSSVLDKAEGMLESVTRGISNLSVDKIREKAVQILHYADDATDRLFHAFCIFVLTTLIIPLALFLLLGGLLRLFSRQFTEEAPQVRPLLTVFTDKTGQLRLKHEEE